MLTGKSIPFFRRSFTLLLLLPLFGQVANASPPPPSRFFSVDAGYVTTSSSNYGNGLVYGISIIEGEGRIGFAIVTSAFSNSIFYDAEVMSGEAQKIYRYEEKFSDFYITILATFRPSIFDSSSRILGGIGPQVHFLRATKYYITDGYSVSARDFRLGMGIWLRFHRQIHIFGNTAIVITATHSWAQGAGENIEPFEYTVPDEGLAFPAVTAGLAFPF